MKSTSAFCEGDIVLPLPQHFIISEDKLFLPDGTVVRHGDNYNVTIISHFLVAVRPLDADAEVVLNFNLCFYDMRTKETEKSGHCTFNNPTVFGFRYLDEDQKQSLYVMADETVRQQAIAGGFLPRGNEGGIDVRHVKGTPMAFSSRAHRAEDVVFESAGVLLPFPIRSTVEVPGDRHLRLTGGSEFIFHSCLPNLRLELDGDRIRGVALRSIEEGEKLTYNYLCTEWEVSKVFNCACNVYCCYGLIKGFRFLDREQQEHLLPNCSQAVKEKHCSPLLEATSLCAIEDSSTLSTAPDGLIVSQRYIPPGVVLCAVEETPRLEQNYLVLKHIRLPHSCDANTVLVDGRLLTSRPLAAGDLITFNLGLLFYRIDTTLSCHCGASGCTKVVRGFGDFSPAERDKQWLLASDAVRTEAVKDHHTIASSSHLVDVQDTAGMGNATFATRNIAAGTRIFHVRGLVLPFPTTYTIYLGEGKHLLFAGGAQCLAHSCNPNTRIVVDPSSGSLDCFATRPISPREVISFNYLSTEWDMSTPFTCCCGSSSCAGRIAGFRRLKRSAQLQLWPTATKAVQSLFALSIRQASSILATMDSSVVAPCEAGGILSLCQDYPSGTVLLEAPHLAVDGATVHLGDVKLSHSCGPSAVFLEGRVVLCNACPAGTPITLNVNQLCFALPSPFTCSCGDADCCGVVGGFGSLSQVQKERILLCTLPEVRAEATAAGFKNPSSCPLVDVRENGVMGQATFAARSIPRGARFFKVSGLVLPFPTVYTIQLDRGRHLQFADGAQCLAHSCQPNVRVIVDAESRSLDCLAIRDISEGEVISFNYLTTEWNMSTPFRCVCGCTNCFGQIKGLKHLSQTQRQSLWWMLTPAMRDMAATNSNWEALASAQLKTNPEGHVLAARALTEGTPLLTANQVQIRKGGVMVDEVRLRHSCQPTAAVVEGRVVLLETLCVGNEVTVDLNCLAYVLESFLCDCTAYEEVHEIQGFSAMTDAGRAARLIFTEPSVRALALRDGYAVPCSCERVTVRANGDMGQATFAATNISRGTRFLQVKGLCIPFPTLYTIMLDEGRHLLFADGAQCLAHSCNPNVRVCVDAIHNTLECVALRDISSGELIAFNYNATEWDMSAPFRCLCGSAETCVQEVRGFKYLTFRQREMLQNQATPAIKALAASYADVKLPPTLLRAATNGSIEAKRQLMKGVILLEVYYLDIQPHQIHIGGNYNIAHRSNEYNCVLVDGRIISSRVIEAGEQLFTNLNFFVYDMTKLFPSGCVEDCKGFRFMDDATKQQCLYLCEPPVRAEAMKDGWIVKSTQPLLTVRPNGDMGQTAYATQNIASGTQLYHCTGLVIPFPTMYTICVGDHQHLLFGDAAECIAHHCDPNVMVRVDTSTGTLDFIAIRDICCGDMVTFNYATTEWDMSTPFVCLCGSPLCAGTMQGFRHLPRAEQQRLWPITSEVVKQLCRD